MSVTIYHNPSCGTSRNTLAMIRQSGAEPTVIEYLKTPPSRDKLKELVAAMGISVRALLREKGTPYKELRLDDPKWTDDQLLDQMLAHPILINRPIVVTPKGTQAVPAFRDRARDPAEPGHGKVREGGWRGCRNAQCQSLKREQNE
jgi:arsenate reductase